MARTSNALKILERVTGPGESVRAGIAQARSDFHIAQRIYDARIKAGLSQAQLAAMIGAGESDIEWAEDGDHEALQRIASAMAASGEGFGEGQDAGADFALGEGRET